MCDSNDLIEACKNGYYEKVVNLLQRNFTVHVRDSKQATPLYYSSCQGYYNICHILIQYGSDVNARVEWGSTALHAAADRGHIDCVKLLVGSGADLSIQNQRGDTALHLSAYRGHIEIVKVLIQYHCDLFIKNNNEKTAYDEAEGNNQDNTASLLRQYMLGNYSGVKHGSNNDNRQHLPQQTNGHVPAESSPLTGLSQPSNGIDNFVRYSSDLTKFTRQSAPIIRQDSIPEKRPKQVRPASQPHYRQQEIGLPQNGSYVAYQTGYDSGIKNGSSTMIDNKKLLILKSREALETFAENLQMQVLKVSDECETKEKTIQQQKLVIEGLHAKIQSICLSNSQSDSFNLEGRNNKSGKQSNDCNGFRLPPVSHQSIFSALTKTKDHGHTLNSSESLETFKEVLKSKHLNRTAPVNLDEPGREWKVGTDFILLGDKPLNCIADGDRDGSCSLVFHIKHKAEEYVLKMMTNLLNLQTVQHGDGYSLDPFLAEKFGSEHNLPVNIPFHPNIITIRHHYIGATERFKKFMNLLIPVKLDVPIEMANRTSFLVMDKYQQTLKSFMVQQRTVYSKPSFGLDSKFLLQLLYQILSAISHLKKHDIVHRNIKSDNIVLDNYLRPILTDFGFAKSVRSSNSRPLLISDDEVCAGNNHAWAPELLRHSRQHLTQRGSGGVTVPLYDIYSKTDAYAVGRMFFSLLRSPTDGDHFPQSTVTVPHYNDSDIPELPVCYSEGLRWLLHNLVLDDPSKRLSERKAMLCAGMMLFPPSNEDINCESDALTYCQARTLTLLALDSHSDHIPPGRTLSVEQSINRNTLTLECDFLYSVTPAEFWDIYYFLRQKSLL